MCDIRWREVKASNSACGVRAWPRFRDLPSGDVSPAAKTYLGMDRNDYPGDANMVALRKTFTFTGYWLNNPPGSTTNTWQGKRKTIQAMGYGFLLLFNGREYRQLQASGNAAQVGSSDAAAAVKSAAGEGFPKGSILFLDQEQGGRMLPDRKSTRLNSS